MGYRGQLISPLFKLHTPRFVSSANSQFSTSIKPQISRFGAEADVKVKCNVTNGCYILPPLDYRSNNVGFSQEKLSQSLSQ